MKETENRDKHFVPFTASSQLLKVEIMEKQSQTQEWFIGKYN